MKRPTLGPGGIPLPYNQLSEQDLDELASYNPTLTYGQAKQAPPEEFVPAYVAFDKKVVHYFFCKTCLLSFGKSVWLVNCDMYKTDIDWMELSVTNLYINILCTKYLLYCTV